MASCLSEVCRRQRIVADKEDDVDDIEAIRQLKARYFRTMDTKDWQGMRRVFTDDVVVDTSAAGGSMVSGADEFMAFLQEALNGAVTVHQGHMPEIDLTSPTTATGIWALNDLVIWPNGMRLDGYGHYHETYEKTGDHWLIKSSTLTRLHVDLKQPED
jgi:uncharacterized protein (TIGR02246 family)